MTLQGGCHCGALRYQASGEGLDGALCHCVDCRRTTGAPAVAWFSVKTDDFRYVQGEPTAYLSSDHAERAFCGRCGAQITFADKAYEGARVDVTTASLDDPDLVPLRQHIYTKSRIGWMNDLSGLPEKTMEDQP